MTRPGKIFLADQRGELKNAQFHSLQLFSSEHCYNRDKQAMGDLHQLNDHWLAPDAVITENAGNTETVILLPLYGALEVKLNEDSAEIVTAGQLRVINPGEATVMGIRNPFADEVVNYLSIRITRQASGSKTESAVSSFDLQQFMNVLVQVWPPALTSADCNWCMSLGKFSGRGETIYHLRNPENSLFFFVISGAFEVEGRLLHPRDGLALWNLEAAETEALSNEALLLVLEISQPVSVL